MNEINKTGGVRTKKDLKFFLEEDAKVNDMACGMIKYFLYLFYGMEKAHAYRYIKTMRYLEYHSNNLGLFHKFMSLFYKVKLSRLGMKYHLHIIPNSCGYGLKIYHVFGGGQILNVRKVGNYCTFNAGCVLGTKEPDETPTIGNHVYVAPGAKVFGSVVIGNNVVIAPNAIVTKDIPDNAIVGGVPAKIIKMKKY